MSYRNDRYIFLDYKNLMSVEFKKLAKIADRIFIFISSAQDNIPFEIVSQMQKFGKKIKWVLTENDRDEETNYHLAFYIGQLHEKVIEEIEFAIFSENDELDSLVRFINATGRNCIRISNEIETKDAEKIEEPEKEEIESNFPVSDSDDFEFGFVESSEEPEEIQNTNDKTDSLIEKTAQETIQRLIRSGNRPAEIELLKNYIILNTKEKDVIENINEIIVKLEETEELQVKNNEVVYKF